MERARRGAIDAALQRVLEGRASRRCGTSTASCSKLQQLALQRDKDVAAYQAVVQRAWTWRFERFAKTSRRRPSRRQATWRGSTDRWLAIANETLIEVHRSDEFLEAQRRMLRAASDCRLQEREIAEAWCEAAHMPTRTEVDELQRTVTELRREAARAAPRRRACRRASPSARGTPRPRASRAPRSAARTEEPRHDAPRPARTAAAQALAELDD